jgi:hypothetical protein
MAGLDTPSSTSSENPEEHYYEDFVKKVKSQKFLSNPNYLE